MSRKWTEEQRQQQAERIRRQKPWEKSTGPRTAAGKERAKMNAFRHGDYFNPPSERLLRKILRLNKAFVASTMLWAQTFPEDSARWNELRRKREESMR